MARKFYTIFVLPHAQSQFRKIHFSKNFIWTVAAIVGVAVAAGAVAPNLFLTVLNQAETIERLKDENRRLLDEKKTFEASVAELGSVVETVEDRARRLARAVGLDRAPGVLPEGGGPSRLPARTVALQRLVDEEIEALRVRSMNLDRSLDRLDEIVRENERRLASTPAGFPVEGFLSAGYGWRDDPFTGEREFHRGLDIVAPTGAAVRAAADGVVGLAGRLSGYGRMVQLSHGYGYQTRYGHLSEVLVRPGQRVRKGDLIGRVGSTGRSTGPHLHYEIYKAGRRVNPYRYTVTHPA